MLSKIKLGNCIYENIEPKTIDENGNEIWNIPNDLEQLKQAYIDTLKWQAHRKLRETDWVIIKCVELHKDPSQEYPEIIEQRQTIRDWCDQKEEEINNATSIEELLEIDIKLTIQED